MRKEHPVSGDINKYFVFYIIFLRFALIFPVGHNNQ